MKDVNLVSPQEAVSEASAKKGKEGEGKFRPFASLCETIRDHHNCSKSISLLRSSMHKGSDGEEEFGSALKLFESVNIDKKAKIICEAGKLLDCFSLFPFESARNTSAITVISLFVAEAAAKIGAEEITGLPTGKLVSTLKHISLDNSLYSMDVPAHNSVKLAAAAALWQLGYDDFSFWNEKLASPVTRDFTITNMLDMPETASFDEHGWYLLRQNLSTENSIAIALNSSAKKGDFLLSMLLDTDQKIVSHSLEGLIYLQPLPASIIESVKEISERSPALKIKTSQFLAVVSLRSILFSADDSQFMAARQLITFYKNSMPHLRLFMDDVSKEMKEVYFEPSGKTDDERKLQQQKALEILVDLHLAGIRTEGFTFNIQYG